ncbi:MAG: glycosyltransferase family 4 protein [Salibacteraceae bacterium]
MSVHKPRVVIFVDWYLPGCKAGGPVRSVAAMVAAFKHDFSFSIITSDRDFGDEKAYPTVPVNQWIEKDDYRVQYLSPSRRGRSSMKELLKRTPAEVYYFNSLFSLHYTLIPLLLLKGNRTSKKVLAPRGMLGAGALALKSGKKKLFLSLAKAFGLYKNIHWHASSDLEKEEVHQVFVSTAKVQVARNLSRPPEVPEADRVPKKDGMTRFFFLSRISRKKNLHFALKLLQTLPESGNYTFDIIGPVEDEEYWQECQALIEALNPKVAVTHHGAVPFHQIGDLMKGLHFLLLPTFHENFGHVVVESMACGCPVLISENTPWKHLQQSQTGWDIPLQEKETWEKALRDAAQSSKAQFDNMSNAARSFALQHLDDQQTLEANRQLFKPN